MEGKKGESRGYLNGQSLVEYFILFAILAGLSLFLLSPQNPKNIPAMFSSYVSTATEKMK